jgi:mono/diheme cytochrome c family protein
MRSRLEIMRVEVSVRGWWTVVLASILLGSIVPAQGQSPSPASTLNPQQWAGRRLFLQNCAICHLARPDNPKSTEAGSAYGGDLTGLFEGQRPMTEEAVQTFIQQGLPKKMPGFQYGMKLDEIQNIIAYLKTL